MSHIDNEQQLRKVIETGHQEPFAWLVCSVNKDRSLSLEGAEQFQEKAQEAINDAISDRLHGAKDWVVRPAYLQAPQHAVPEVPISSKRVYLIATGETCNGLETYTRHEALVPMADQEVLWTAEPMAKLFVNFAAADLATWSREMLEQFVGRAHEELVKLLTWTGELYATPLSNDTMRAIRTRALDEFGTGQAQGELWDQILMRETARTIQATAKGGA